MVQILLVLPAAAPGSEDAIEAYKAIVRYSGGIMLLRPKNQCNKDHKVVGDRHYRQLG